MTEEDLYQKALAIRDIVFDDNLADPVYKNYRELLALRLKALQVITLSHIESHLWQLCEQTDGVNTGLS